MSIAENINQRNQANALIRSMLELVKDDFLAMTPHGQLCFFQIGKEYFDKRFAERNATPATKKPDQRSDSNATAGDSVEEAIESLEHLMETCEEIPPAGYDFAASVRGQAADMINDIEESNRVTHNQLRAIKNWQEGANRWLRS